MPAEARSALEAARCDASPPVVLAEVLFWEADFPAAAEALRVDPPAAWAEELDFRRVLRCREGLLITIDWAPTTGL